ncbi:hypothetical protein [Dactylosporangium sp. NPDC005555]|uniref:hypothetical protein n=1 Tax=Dactylosporangium sp. NPDC005555 TaxID=3154889 RepID=UPI0033A79EE2
MIEYLRGRRTAIVRRQAANALERGLAGGAGQPRSGPFWPADNWVFVVYAAALTCAAAVVLGIRWLDAPPLGRTVLAGIAAAGFLLAGLHLVKTPARRERALRQFLTDPRDRAVFEEAASHADRIMLTWPALERLGDPTDPRDTLERMLWDLAHALAERGELRTAVRELRASVGEPIGAGLLFAAVTDRQAELTAQLTTVDAEVVRRVERLRHLAGLCQGFLDHRAAQSRARVRVEAADALLGAISARPGRDPEPTETLTERTETVLAAYRELADEFG